MAHCKQIGRRTLAIGRSLRWSFLLWALLIAGCIPSSSKYPYQAAETNGGEPDADVSDATNDVRDGEACEPETDKELCDAESVACGAIDVLDSCGEARRVEECGGCADNETCVDNDCCVLADLATACDGFCGSEVTVRDPQCGTTRQLDCSEQPCDPNEPCNDGTCGECMPETDETVLCSNAEAECGNAVLPNGCGQDVEIDCGGCEPDEMCDRNRCVCAEAVIENVCGDKEDNDCDDLIDCEDPDCRGEICREGIGGLADSHCTAQGECKL